MRSINFLLTYLLTSDTLFDSRSGFSGLSYLMKT